MKAFTQLFDEIDQTTSTREKIEALKRYFGKVNPEDAMWAVLILTSRISKKVITARSLRESFQSMTDYPEWLFEESYAQVGDTAETIALLLQSLELARERPDPAQERTLTEWLDLRIPELGAIKDARVRAEKLMSYWTQMTPAEIFVLNKLMTGGFRVGVSEKLVIRALAEVFDISSDQIAHRISGKITPGAASFEALISKEETAVLGSKPYPFCLAHAWNERSERSWEAGAWALEWKFDGIRSQVIKRDDTIWIWSRGEEEISRSFPDLVSQLKDLPNGSVIDGEVLVIMDGRIEPFQTLQKRLGRKKLTPAILKETPVGFIAYDCLEMNGQDLRQFPLRERRDCLEAVLGPLLTKTIRISPTLTADTLDELEALRAQSRGMDAEGLMIKAWESPYSVGRKTGHWWKHKVDPLTLDAVLIYAQAGSGRRANLYTDYTFALWKESLREEDAAVPAHSAEAAHELVPFAKAYSGLDQKEIDELDRWIRQHTKEKFGPVRSVDPQQVFEIAFEGIAKSARHKSGIAVRFPRILRWRRDKKAEDADTLATASDLLDLAEARSGAVPAAGSAT